MRFRESPGRPKQFDQLLKLCIGPAERRALNTIMENGPFRTYSEATRAALRGAAREGQPSSDPRTPHALAAYAEQLRPLAVNLNQLVRRLNAADDENVFSILKEHDEFLEIINDIQSQLETSRELIHYLNSMR